MHPTPQTHLAHESTEHDPDTLDLTLRYDALGIHRPRWTWGERLTLLLILAMLVAGTAHLWWPLIGREVSW